MSYNNVYRSLYGEIMGESDKALKFEFEIDEDNYKTEWFPFSQIQTIHRLSKPDNDLCDIILVSEWILKQKGIMHLAVIEKPKLSEPSVPTLSDKLVTKPAPNFSDMDDDIPF